MRGKSSPYEVRCLRCDVSFPLETRRCIHCGGPISASTSAIAIDALGPPPPDPFARGGPLEATRPPPVPSVPMPPGASDDPVEDQPAGPTSVVGTLLRSFGSLFWIVALVAFSMLRNCQGEG